MRATHIARVLGLSCTMALTSAAQDLPLKKKGPRTGGDATNVQIDAAQSLVQPFLEAYVKDDPALRKQAIDGWTRVLYLKYGTDYSHKAGQALVERLKK